MRVKLSDLTKFSKGVQINGDNLIDDGQYIYLNGGINPSGRWNEANVDGNTITISEGGNSSGYVNYLTEPFWCGAHCYYLYDGPKNTKYFYYALKSQQDRLFRMRSGACMPNIKKSDLGKFEFEYNSDETKQNEVVSILSMIEAIIDKRKKELVLLDNLIKARFVEMFGNPETNTKGWNKDLLQNHADVMVGYPFSSEGYTDSGIKIVGGYNLMQGFILWEESKHWQDSEGYEQFLLRDNDIVMAMDRPWVNGGFKIARIDLDHLPALLIQRTACIRSKDMTQEFLYYLLDSKRFAEHCNITGSLVPHISNKDINSFCVIVPPLEEQKRFSTFVQQVDKSKFIYRYAIK